MLGFRDRAAIPAAAIPFTLRDYLNLLDWAGRRIRSDKRGAIDPAAPPILTRWNIDPEAWQQSMQLNSNVFGRAMGQLDHLRMHAKALGQAWIEGLRQAQRLYPSA